ncbi:hypothetical protein FM996_20245 [Methylosinus sporium]|uniref:Uncharacterized protein n=1 Tax=Methylosinus sporium TaxID=428 RepID=A0A549SD74_METSR|nr:hypothetical protein [Methylosinus sporium]TRL24688.1 hypothetical protein FM996_20245 [Methylosinus sporium]
MGKTISSALPTVAVDYDATLILAVETSNKSWVVAAHVPGLGNTGSGEKDARGVTFEQTSRVR